MKNNLLKIFIALIAVFWAVSGPPKQANAAEGGSGVYLLGYQNAFMGAIPPPGFYFRNDLYYYNASVDRAVLQGRVNANLNALVLADALTFSYVPKLELPGKGSYGAALVLPVMFINLQASATVGNQTVSRSGNNAGLGDMALIPLILGWHRGNFHFIFDTFVVFPTGRYSVNRVINVGKNHFAFDPGIGFTWYNPALQHEVSFYTGVTINLENSDTDYRTGEEFHFEGAYNYHLKNGVMLGVVGYVYQQITGDSGSGAILGDFQGRVFGAGPQIGWSTVFKKRPFSVSGRYYKEFGAKNRFEGNALFLTVTYKLF